MTHDCTRRQNPPAPSDDIRPHVVAAVMDAILAGHINVVIRPDGLLGYELSDAGHKWLEENEE